MNSGPCRIALQLEYHGAAYSGWQKQRDASINTVQNRLELALSQIASSSIEVQCAGRTDSQVHATSQVVHFDTPIDRGAKAWEQGVNSLLPDDVKVIKASRVDDLFHARFSAEFRRYNYIVHETQNRSAFLHSLTTQSRTDLDIDLMNIAAESLLGEQDFSAFRAAGCQSKSPNRNIIWARFFRVGKFIVFDVCANAFLQHMVRNMMGSLLKVGAKTESVHWIAELIAGKDRTLAAMTAPASGLYLVEVGYPKSWAGLGKMRMPPVLLSSQ